MRPHARLPLEGFKERAPEEMAHRARDFYGLMARRRTIRDFSDRPVDRAIIEDCIRTAGTAPSGANHQPWHFALIGDPKVKKDIRAAAEAEERAFYEDRASAEWLEALAPLGTDDVKPYLETAPWLIAIFAQRRGGIQEDGKTKNYYVSESVGIATGFLIAALHNAGLATLTHTPKPMDFLNRICKRPDHERAYILLVAGYPAKDATVPEHALEKKPLSQIVSYF